jgi:glycosyltransferase 2 family protein
MFRKTLSSPTLKKYLNIAGLGLGFLGVVYIVFKFKDLSSEINISSISNIQWVGIVLTFVIYCGACIIQGFAWHNILLHLKIPVSPKWSIPNFGISQIAKYIPGNIFQFASRQAIGVSEGLPGVPLAKSIVWELGLMAGTAALFAVFIVPVFNQAVSPFIAVSIFIFLQLLILIIIGRLVGRRISYSIGLYGIFFTTNGLIFLFIITYLLSNTTLSHLQYLSIFGIYIFAWLVGFITPGAPAGVGIREVVLLTLLIQFIPQGLLLLAIVIMRFSTVVGDVLYYGLSWFLKRRYQGEKKTTRP